MSVELKSHELHRCCEPSSLGFKTTEEVEPLAGALGQEEAMEALSFGVSVASKGYNIFALGRAGSGRRTFGKFKALPHPFVTGTARVGAGSHAKWNRCSL